MTPPTAEHVQGMLNGEASNDAEPFTTPIARVIARLWADVYERVEGKAMDGRGEVFNEGEKQVTQAQISTIVDQECVADALQPVNAAFVRTSLRGVLTRLLCHEPTPPAVAKSSTNDVAAPAKDRAEELAEKIVFQHGAAWGADMIIGEWGRGSVWVKGYSSSVESVRLIFAMALRAYADEVLENAAATAIVAAHDSWMVPDVRRQAEAIRALKSSAPKP